MKTLTEFLHLRSLQLLRASSNLKTLFRVGGRIVMPSAHGEKMVASFWCG